MIQLTRQEFKTDPVFKELFLIIKQNHKVAAHTERVLLKNKHIKDFCEEARHFFILQKKSSIYLHYDVSSWYTPGGARVKIESIGVYDNQDEFEAAKRKELNSTIHADGANLN